MRADAGGEPGLVGEHLDELRVLRVLRVQALDRHRAREPRGAERPPEVHGRHPARRDLSVEDVAAEHGGAALARGRIHAVNHDITR
jgi:hypothetical protein